MPYKAGLVKEVMIAETCSEGPLCGHTALVRPSGRRSVVVAVGAGFADKTDVGGLLGKPS